MMYSEIKIRLFWGFLLVGQEEMFSKGRCTYAAWLSIKQLIVSARIMVDKGLTNVKILIHVHGVL